MNEKLSDFSNRRQELERSHQISAAAAALVDEMLTELQLQMKQNELLRKSLRTASGQIPKMSSRLRDALYE